MTVDEETVPALLHARAKDSPDAVAFAYESNGGWKEIRWKEFLQRVETLAAGLRAKGLKAGDHVGILAPTSLEWELAHHAVLAAGGVVVGLEPHDTAERLQYITEHARLRILAVANAALLQKLSAEFVAALKLVVLFEGTPEQASTNIVPLSRLRDAPIGEPIPSPPPVPKASATVIYTSGTTGQPKGILYRHDQVTLAVRAIIEAYPSLPVGSRFVCWLPLSNLFQRIMNLAALATGGTVFLVSNPLEVLKALPHARPDVFIGVPRFYEKLREGILREVARKPASQRAVIEWAIASGDRYARALREGRRPSVIERFAHRLADRLVLARLRRVMGGSIRFMVTGSAPTPVRLLEFFHALGLPLLEAYGMSENIVPIAMNRPDAYCFGTVGRPLPENDLRIAPDGELLVRGKGVFAGYLGDPGKSVRFDQDGYFATGDYAELKADGFLCLKGRKSEIIKTSTGRRISPIAIEARLQEVPEVERAVIIGSGRKCLCAILAVPNESPESSPVPPSANASDLVEGLRPALRHVADALSEAERPAGYIVVRKPFSIDSGELTANLKLRRNAIEERYQAYIDELYAKLDEGRDDIIIVDVERLPA